uniref:Fanconi anemia group M protein n=1 Tax=Hyaloperonospora arabidopsidis (strain Emoy2) TaxID=559515 RepID=M4BYH3_HYAAE
MEDDEWDDALLLELAALETQALEMQRHQDLVHKHQPAAAAVSSAGALDSWSCRSCTLQNKASSVACTVCATPRTRSALGKKTVQATLSFDGNAAAVATARPRLPQKMHQEGQHIATATIAAVTTAAATTAADSTRAAAVPLLRTPRHAAGEDVDARLRYLDVETTVTCPPIDCEAAQYFVYPTNYSIRDYQLTIAEKALYHNTLVALPTGLGKTLVAAVVMYNFYRWFPTGKIVFMAPTKPLVAQQIKACHEIMGISLSDTAELQGNVPPTMRRVLWKSRRVFFCTPQSLQNDLKRGVCAAEKFVCIVVDEAHRATGNYAYCCVVQEIEAKTQFFRVLALSATPGAKFDVIQDVVTNLRISHIECRSADDSDVKKYTHVRQEEVVICRLGTHILEVKAKFMKCFIPIVQRLLRSNIIQYADPEKLTSWYVLQAREKFRKSPNYESNRSAESDLALLVSLLHAKSLLTGHGLSSFQDQITNWVEERKKGKMSWSKREMLHSSEFQSLELSLAATASTDGSASHPKLIKLREVLLEHFKRRAAGKSNTRAIVFTQYRASVSEIVALLRPLAPLLNVQPFIGQGASGKAKENKGQSQKVQQDIVRRFRSGDYNVLVATCIAEEGLDIGEVDLIVSFDALTSPVRMIQRMGRTGRKRVGRVIILVTEGEEQKKLARSASAAKTVSRALTTFKSRFTYSKCPRMLPAGICPQLRELAMKIPTFHASQVGGKTASGAVDPNLWQLSEAERAVALMKYFPPNFAASSRNRLYPVVANRRHLLRRQPRSLARKNVGTVVGYSSRSLMLQALVRKIRNAEVVLEIESDSEDDKSGDENGNETGVTDSSIVVLSESTKQRVGRRGSAPLRNDRYVSGVDTGTKQSDGEAGSLPRHRSAPSELDGDARYDRSFASMNETADAFDMHFSPQFVDAATQSIEESERQNRDSAQDGQKKQMSERADSVSIEVSGSLGLECTTSTTESANKASEVNPCRSPNVSETIHIGVNHTDSLTKSHQMSTASPLAVASDRLRPPPSSCEGVCYEVPAGQENGSWSTQVPIASRSRSMRQLQFSEIEDGDHSMERSQSTKIPQREALVKDSETVEAPEKQDVSIVEDEDHSNFSFALFPTDPCTGEVTTKCETERLIADEDPAEEVSFAYSFALLPPIDKKNGGTSDDHGISAKSTEADSEYQSVLDSTDFDEVSGADEVTIVDKDGLVGNKRHTESNVLIATPEKAGHYAVVKVNKRSMVEGTMKLLETRVNDNTHKPSQSQLIETELKQVDEACCSICRESESYDDDPIVFCDGCDVAVHQFCYGISVVPSGKWFCDFCADTRKVANANKRACQLCPLRNGALKRTKCGKWVHVQCFLWIPELRVENSDDELLVLGDLSILDQDRKTLDCSLCHSQKGNGKIQCAHKRCLTAFHVSCAAFAHYRMDQLDSPDGEESGCGTLFLAYCSLHRDSRASANFPMQPNTPFPVKARDSKPSLPTVAKLSSPSHLLTSPPSAEAKNKFKTFRRLKRKYDATQSQMFSQPEKNGSPSTSPPWQKHIRRSKRRRETSRVLAAAYIEDAAEVRGGAGCDDDDEDDYGDEYKEAADDSFINDSSQLLYSQSVVSPEDTDQDQSKKKKRKKSSPNMRAIYARSLFESQSSPLLLRPGGRQLGALPSNGIIQACLTKLQNLNGADPLSSRPRSSSRMLQTTEDVSGARTASPVPICASAVVIDSDGDDSVYEAEPSPSFDLLGSAKLLQRSKVCTRGLDEQEVSDNASTADTEVAMPISGVVGAKRPHAGTAITNVMDSKGRDAEELGRAQLRDSLHDNDEAELRKKVEANRIKALKKLDERRQMELQHARLQHLQQFDEVPLSNNGQRANNSNRPADRCTGATSSIKAHGNESGARNHAARAIRALNSPVSDSQRAVTTVDLTGSEPTKPSHSQQDRLPKWTIFVSSTFASSQSFPHFLSTKSTGCAVLTDDSLEADALLSVRAAVLFLTGQQLHELSLTSLGQQAEKGRRFRTLLAMHKKVVMAVVYDGSNIPEVPWLKQLPNATFVIRPRFDSLCIELHQFAHQELAKGYELPSPSLCYRDVSDSRVKGLDANFASRLEFFRALPPLSLDSALSLSFRFENFAAKQVPVLKFNEMHWRRMLPWISESAARQIQEHFKQNAQRH